MTKKRTVKSDAVAILTKGTVSDAEVPKLLEHVNKQIAAIKEGIPDTPITNEELPGFGKIEDISTVDDLLKAGSMVRGKEKLYKEVAKELIPVKSTIKVPKFKLGNHTSQEWMSHIKARIVIVGNYENLRLLEEARDILKTELSAEAKRAEKFNKIKGLFDINPEEVENLDEE